MTLDEIQTKIIKREDTIISDIMHLLYGSEERAIAIYNKIRL